MSKVTHIAGKRWFDSKNGNTYHSVTIFYADGSHDTVPYTYGYGDQFIETALQRLEEKGEITRKQYANGGRQGGSFYLRETLGATYSVADVSRKRDL